MVGRFFTIWATGEVVGCIYSSPQMWSKSVSDKSYQCISHEMGKRCCFPGGSDTRRVFVGSSEGLEGWIWGCWQVVGSSVLLRQGALHSGSSWTTWHACQGCREWRAFLYVTSYCMPSLLPFLSFSFSFTSMLLRFINSLFMTSAAIRMSNKETGENPVFLCLSLFAVLAYLLFPLCFFF